MTRSRRASTSHPKSEESKKLFSIVTISFNQATYLRECLESVISQKAEDVEYIVVDPGSTDGSRDIINEYRGKIDKVIFEKDNGPADGLNKGFSESTGKVGYFINSDDYLLPGAIDRMRRYWSNFPELKLLLGRAWRVREDGSVERELIPTPNTKAALISGAVTVVQQGFSFDMGTFWEIGGFNNVNRSTWDYELLARFAEINAKHLVVNDRFGAFRLYAGGLSGGSMGAAHELRFESDYKRIHSEFLSAPIETSVIEFLNTGKRRKVFQHPSLVAHRLTELALPWLKRRKFEADLSHRK